MEVGASTCGLLSGKKAICVVTGATRGIGREIATQLAGVVAPGSAFILMGRNEHLLKDTVSQLKNISDLMVKTIAFDLNNFNDPRQKDFVAAVRELLNSGEPYEVALMIHNAGSLGDNRKKAEDFQDPAELREYLEINVVSFILINNLFLKCTGGDIVKFRQVVNISSLVAIQGLSSYAVYAAGKAAREGFLRVLAVENSEIRVLNYSPGPVMTDMQKEVQQNAWDPKMKEWSKKAESEGKLLCCAETVNKLIKFLNENGYDSGAHVDFYD